MTHANVPLSAEGRRRLIERCKTRPIARVAAERGISRATASKWVNRRHGGMVISRRTVTRHLAVLGLNRRKFIDPNGRTDREPHTITARRPLSADIR